MKKDVAVRLHLFGLIMVNTKGMSVLANIPLIKQHYFYLISLANKSFLSSIGVPSATSSKINDPFE